MIIGIDKGSAYTKTSKDVIIKSTVRDLSEDDINLNDSLFIEMDGEEHFVGGEGSFATDLKKAEHKSTRILTYTAIAKSFEETLINTDLVLGLPIGHYSRNKDKMKELFNGKSATISINGNQKVIKIMNVEVFPECAAAKFTQNIDSGLFIDIGGLSVDNALFKNGKLEKHSTFTMGTMKLLSKIADYLNAEHDLSLTEWGAEEILKDGLTIDGEVIDIKSGTEEVIRDHVKKILERIKLQYDTRMIKNIIFTGGGSLMCFDFFKKYIPQATRMENTQFSNAKGFELIGRKLFGGNDA
ncbi:hypothetical protein [Wukongibacter sp. M2B1]|uniref:ParM/StbA family protein n=1 Tax=Wukongibacter sp. M2B1 TaxID=3088895 RepID=UPI003D7B58DD